MSTVCMCPSVYAQLLICGFVLPLYFVASASLSDVVTRPIIKMGVVANDAPMFTCTLYSYIYDNTFRRRSIKASVAEVVQQFSTHISTDLPPPDRAQHTPGSYIAL